MPDQKMGIGAGTPWVSVSKIRRQMGAAARARRETSHWLRELRGAARALRRNSISPVQWQEEMNRIFATVPLDGLCRRLHLDELKSTILEQMSPERGEYFHRVVIPGISRGSHPEPKRALITKVAHVRKGYSVPPHSHSNMVSAFLCLSGEFEVHQFDVLEVLPEHLVVRRTMHETSAGAGTWTTLSDYRDNVHWLTAKTDDCFLFSCKLNHLEEGKKFGGRIHIDILGAEASVPETFVAPKITPSEAARIYAAHAGVK